MESNEGKPIASYNRYLMQQTVRSAYGTKQFWKCATRVCHGTAESVFGKTNGLVNKRLMTDVDKDLKEIVLNRDFTITTREERFLLWDS
uniref:Uncharacterized protein n=1 Tax=Ditylenchus dipsaci TaxID=166011 RepID=A0A915CZB7_9BILA